MDEFSHPKHIKIERFNFAVNFKNSIFNAFSLLLPTKHITINLKSN